jgi:hypothetical protein
MFIYISNQRNSKENNQILFFLQYYELNSMIHEEKRENELIQMSQNF